MALRELVSEIRQSVYAVIIERSQPQEDQMKLQVVGTAFAISSNGHFITADHVVNPDHSNPAGQARLPNDKIILAQIQGDGMTANIINGPCQVASMSQQQDYAILNMQLPLGRVQYYLELDFGQRFEGEEVAICGYPLATTQMHPESKSITINLNIRVAAGIISTQRIENNSKLLEVDFPILPGNSGGPLFSVRSGKVLGLATATFSALNNVGHTIGHVGIIRDIRNLTQDLKKYL